SPPLVAVDYPPVPRTRSSHSRVASALANFGFKSGTGIIVFASVLRFRSSHRGQPQSWANFGIGTLAPGRDSEADRRESHPLSGGSSRGMAAPFSGIIMGGAAVSPDVIVGITEASTPRSPVMPNPRKRSSTPASGSVSRPFFPVPTG